MHLFHFSNDSLRGDNVIILLFSLCAFGVSCVDTDEITLMWLK